MLNCLNPLKLNKEGKYRSIQRYSTGSLIVPCRNCENCRKNRSYEFLVRAYYDYKWFISDKYNKHKGFGLFDTLTFDEAHLPKKKIFKEEFPSFSSAAIKRFKENLEKLAVSRLLDLRELPHNPKNRSAVRSEVRYLFRHIIVSEYGSANHRPHYHIIVFNKIPEFTPTKVERLILDSWVDEKNKPYGGIENKLADQKVIQGLGKLVYVSGYVNKDEDFYTDTLNKKLKDLSIKEKNEFIPRTYYYRGFGKHIFDYYTEEQLLSGEKLKLPNGKSGYNYISLPKYLLDSIIKDTIKIRVKDEEIYVKQLNSKGKEYYKRVFHLTHQTLESDYKKLLEQASNYNYSDDSQYNTDKGLPNIKYTWASIIKRAMEDADINCFQLATYQLLYKGRFGSINPATGKVRLMDLSDYRRRVSQVYSTNYHTDEETINMVYESGIYFNKKLDHIISLFNQFNRKINKDKVDSQEFLKEPKKKFRTDYSKNRKLKFK